MERPDGAGQLAHDHTEACPFQLKILPFDPRSHASESSQRTGIQQTAQEHPEEKEKKTAPADHGQDDLSLLEDLKESVFPLI
jgi:hypothetical protein